MSRLKEIFFYLRLRKLQRTAIRQYKKVYDYFASQTDYNIQIKIHLPRPRDDISPTNHPCYRIYFSQDNIRWKYLDVGKYSDPKDVFKEWKVKLFFSPMTAVECSCPKQRDPHILFNILYPDEFVNEFIYSKDVVIPISV